MISGLNTDIDHAGKTYHVQTEDGGEKNPTIVTHLFAGGAILSSQRSSYADKIASGYNPDVVRELMKQQHQAMIASVTAGEFKGGSAQPTVKNRRCDASAVELPKGRRMLNEVIDEYLQSGRGQRA